MHDHGRSGGQGIVLQPLVHLGQHIFHDGLALFVQLGLASLVQDLAFTVLALRPAVDDVNVGQDRAGRVKPRVFHAVLEEFGDLHGEIIADLDDDLIVHLHDREHSVLEVLMEHDPAPERLQGHLEHVCGRTLHQGVEDVALAGVGIRAVLLAGVGVVDVVVAVPMPHTARERDTPGANLVPAPQVPQVEQHGVNGLVLLEERRADGLGDCELNQVQEGEGDGTLAVCQGRGHPDGVAAILKRPGGPRAPVLAGNRPTGVPVEQCSH